MRDRIQLIANNLVSSNMGDPAAARGQALMALGQTIERQVFAMGYGGAFAELGAVLMLVAIFAILFRRRRSQSSPSGQPGCNRTSARRPSSELLGQSRRTGMRAIFGEVRSFWWFAVVAVGFFASPAHAAPNGSPVGVWATANGHGVIALGQCGDVLCGRIVGIDRKPTEPMPTDVAGRPQCGLTIITNVRPESNATWLGQITDPRDGEKYRAKLWVDAQGDLRLRAFIGIPELGSTQVWHPFTGQLTAECRFA